MHELSGKTALITGASSGLGTDFARQLAAKGTHLVLVARRKKQMEQLKAEILKNHQVDIEIIAADLQAVGAAQKLVERLAAKQIDILINNAGFAVYGKFIDRDLPSQRDMLNLNIITLTELSHLFGAQMAKRGYGHILQVASLAAYQALPNYAAYAASKSYVLLLGEALHYELKPKGVNCTVLCPGVTATEFFEVSGQNLAKHNRSIMMSSNDVVRIGLNAMLARKPAIVAGLANKMLAFASSYSPRRLATQVAYMLMKNR